MFGGHDDPLGYQIRGVEPHSKLPNHTDVGAGGKRLHELLGPRPSDRAEIVDKIGFCHADATIDYGQGVSGLVRDDMDEKLRLGVKLALVRQALEPDFVQCLLRAPYQDQKRSKHQKKEIFLKLQIDASRQHDAYIGRVTDELSKEDLLVGVKSVDDQAEKLVDLRLESEGLRLGRHGWPCKENSNSIERMRVKLRERFRRRLLRR